MGSRARSEEAAAGLSATVDECRDREAGDKPDRSFLSRMKIACVFIAKKGRHEFSWGKTHGSNPYTYLEGMSQTGFLSAE